MKLIHSKKIISLFWVGLLVYGIVFLVFPNGYRFNPQYLVENSVLKNHGFSGVPQEITSPQLKIKAYLLAEHSNPIVSVSFLFKNSGAAYEPQTKLGIGKILADMLAKGAGPYDMTAFNEILEQNAIHLSFNNDKDDFSGNLMFIAQDAKIAAQMLNLALTRPRFTEKDLKQSHSDLATAWHYQRENPYSYLSMETAQLLYGEHPYHRSTYGELKSIRVITSNDLREFMRHHLVLNNLIVGISGDISAHDAEMLLDKIFASLPLKGQKLDIPPAQVLISQKDSLITRKNLPQVIGIFAGLGVPMSNPDFYPLKVALEIFSGSGLSSRVQKSAREQSGLTYGVYGHLSNLDKSDLILGNFSTTPQNYKTLRDLIADEWIKFGEKGVDEKELTKVKDYLMAAEPLRYADTMNLSNILIYMQKYGLGLDFLQKRNTYIENVNFDDVNRIIKKYFTKTNLRFIMIGKFEKQGTVKDENVSQ